MDWTDDYHTASWTCHVKKSAVDLDYAKRSSNPKALAQELFFLCDTYTATYLSSRASDREISRYNFRFGFDTGAEHETEKIRDDRLELFEV